MAAAASLVGRASIETRLHKALETALTLIEYDRNAVVGPARTLAVALEERALSR